jgi:hypothetical protein
VILRTWKIEDNCGNVTTGVQTITFQDKTKPTFTLPADFTENKSITCTYDSDPTHTGIPTNLWDNCDSEPTVSHADAAGTPSCENETVILRTWKIEDNCGNVTTGVQTITFQDKTAPTVITQNIDVDLGVDGTVSITANDVDKGSYDNCDKVLDLVIDPTGFTCSNIGMNTVILTATDNCNNSSTGTATVTVYVPTTTVASVSAESSRYLDKITLYANVTSNCNNNLFTGNVDFYLDGQKVGSAPANPIPFGEAGYSTTLRATYIYTIAQEPKSDPKNDPWEVTATFSPTTSYYVSSTSEGTDLVIYPRLATPYDATLGFYTGDIVGWITDANSNATTVQLTAKLKDISSPTGDVRGAKVTFCYVKKDANNNLIYEPIPSAKDIPVGLIDQVSSTIGFASADVQLSLSKTAESEAFDIAVIISGGYYNDPNPWGFATVTIARTLNKGSIIGNCNVLNDKSAGQIKGAFGSVSYIKSNGTTSSGIPSTNIAFNVVYNKKATNPQGYLNMTVISWYNSQGLLDNKLHTYFIKSNAITSFLVGPLTGKIPLNANQSIFEAKANISELVEILDLDNKPTGSYKWATVEGNSPIRATITDGGGPNGINGDMIAVTYFRSSGGIWFSNNWSTVDAKTIEQQIESDGFIKVETGTQMTKGASIIDPTLTEAKVNVFPNPFTEKLFFEFTSPTATNARLEIFSITGAKIATLFDAPIEAGRKNKAEYVPTLVSSQMVIYRLTMNGETRIGKMVYQERQ